MGITKREIASELGVSKRTIANYIGKLGLGNHVSRNGNTDILDDFAAAAIADALKNPEKPSRQPAAAPAPDSLADSLAARRELSGELRDPGVGLGELCLRGRIAGAPRPLRWAAGLFGFHRGGRVRTGTRACRRSRPRPRRSTGWRDPRTHPGCRRGRPPRRAAGAAPRG